MKTSRSYALLISLFFFVFSPDFSFAESTCYKLGYKYGMCGTKSLHGLTCKKENDIIIPEKCRGKDDTNRGIKDGTKAVYDVLNIKTESKSNIDILSTPLRTLRKILTGKTPDEVRKMVGSPNRTQDVMGYDAWVYGQSYSTDDVAIIFSEGKVMTVTYY